MCQVQHATYNIIEEVSSAAKIKLNLFFSASEGDTNPESQEDSQDESQEEIGIGVGYLKALL